MSTRRAMEPLGVDTVTGRDLAVLSHAKAAVRAVFRGYGYRPVHTPTVEYLELFRDEDVSTSDDMVKLIGRDGRVLVLRPDATVPVSRLAARINRDQAGPVKLSYVTNVYRWADPARGEQMELLQAGVEVFNQPEPDADAEVLALGLEALAAAGVTRMQVDMGHAGWLDGLRQATSLEPEVWRAVLAALEVRSPDLVAGALGDAPVSTTVRALLGDVTQLHGAPSTVLQSAVSLVRNEAMADAVANLAAVLEALSAYDISADVRLDLGLANPSRYYTGAVFQAYTPVCAEPLLQGGRYDGLTARFGAPQAACGLGINLTRVAQLMAEANPSVPGPSADYLITYTPSGRAAALRRAGQLRAQGYVVETEPQAVDGAAQLAAARQRGTRQVLANPTPSEDGGDDETTARRAG